MTLIQPERRFTRLAYILGGMIALVAVVSCLLIVVYVKVVDLEHNIATTKTNIQTLEANSASLRDKTYALLDANSFEALAQSRALVKDRDPHYVTIDHEWSLVSRY